MGERLVAVVAQVPLVFPETKVLRGIFVACYTGFVLLSHTVADPLNLGKHTPMLFKQQSYNDAQTPIVCGDASLSVLPHFHWCASNVLLPFMLRGVLR